MTPIDVVKTRIQVDPALARQSLLSGGRYIVSREGPKALLTGFGPTAVGYLVQVRLKMQISRPYGFLTFKHHVPGWCKVLWV